MSIGCKADAIFHTNGVAMSAFFTALQIENTVAIHVLNAKNKNLVHIPNNENLLPAHWAAKHGKLTSLKYLNIINKDLIRETSYRTDSTCCTCLFRLSSMKLRSGYWKFTPAQNTLATPAVIHPHIIW